jgi:putative salt-induced outer membrane protein YdiY
MEEWVEGGKRVGYGAASYFALLVAVLLAVGTARADEVKVKGDVIHGTVKTVTPDSVVITTDYGKGDLEIPVADVEDIHTEGVYRVLYGDEMQRGKLVGVRDGALLVGEDAEHAVPVPIADIVGVHSSTEYATPIIGPLRSQLEYWEGQFDLGFGLTSSTIDTTTLAANLSGDRNKGRTRFLVNAGYRYGTEKKKGEARSTIEELATGGVRGEYDVLPRLYGFSSGDATYDAVKRISIRGVPKIGLGYKIIDTKTSLFQIETGGAWIYERYFGGDSNDYFGIAFGKRIEHEFDSGSKFVWHTDYLPAVDNFTGDYLIRTEASLLLPMIDSLNLKATIEDEYDSTPAEGADRNRLTTTIGIAFEL